ncbi:MAG: ABC transporter ATP-binding protein [Candidatus Eremiobacteraeota bacterium]|nr:ABC transporter ATP-binding protein [Candidatus Eremiobacteraeota bacterium]
MSESSRKPQPHSLLKALARFRANVWSQECARVIRLDRRALLVPAAYTIGIALLDAAGLLLLIPLLGSLSGSAPPELLSKLLPGASSQQYFGALLALMVFVGLVKAWLSYQLSIFDGRLYHRWSSRLSNYFFHCYLTFGKGFFQASGQSQIWEILEKRFAVLTLFLGIQRLVLNSALLLTHLLVLMLISLPLTIVLTVMIPVVHLVLQWEMRRTKRKRAALKEATSRLYPEAYHVFATLDLYRLYCQEPKAEKRLNEVAENIEHLSVEDWKFQGSVDRLREVVSLICLSILLVFTSQVVVEHPSQLLVYLVFFFVVKNALPLIGSYQQVALDFAQLLPEAEKFCATLERGKSFQVPEGDKAFKALTASVEIKNLTFNYPNGTNALQGLSLSIPAGKTTAIIGESGAGKTTLAELLCCNYEVPRGSIFFDGVDICEFTHHSLRKEIAVVSQQTLLFKGTLRENLVFGCSKEVDDVRLREVLGKTRLLEWVDSLPEGLNTEIGDHGNTISAGQRQRISICRALLREAGIYLVDEPTSNLDQKTRAEVSRVLRSATEGRTVLLIAHQLETVVESDKIVVMENGRVVQEGRFESLVQAEGQFKTYWEARNFAS